MNSRKKGALELSMNTIVIVVIGVTLLVLGLGFVTGIFGNLESLTQNVFGEAENSINQIATHNEKLTIPGEIMVKQGETASSKVWVVNEEPQSKTFTIDITAASENNAGTGIKILVPQKQATVETGGEIGFSVGIDVADNIPKGLYGYNVNIGPSNYAQSSFFVNVE